MSFIDDIIDARSAAMRGEREAVRRVQRGYEYASERLQERIDMLRKMEEAGQSVVYIKGQAEAVLAEVSGLARMAAEDAGTVVNAMRERVILNTLADATRLAEEAGQRVSLAATFSQVPEGAVREMAARPLFGVTPLQSARRIASGMEEDLRTALVGGLAEGSSIGEIATEVEEIATLTETAAARMVRTNLAAASNDALRMAYEANEDVLDGYTWDATLDERVCVRCGVLHGTFFPLGSKPPGPPLHPNCRCVLTPHLKEDGEPDKEEYVRARPLLESGERSRRTELIPSNTRFESWLRKQPSDATINVTGSEIKNSLWRSGKVPFTDLVAPDLTTRTDPEVVRRALSLHPGDARLQSLAEKLGVRKVSKETLRREDVAAEKKVRFTFGERPGVPSDVTNRRAKRDEKRGVRQPAGAR
jgi:SPP1 gp7 family putative phage head morphogenesis protein